MIEDELRTSFARLEELVPDAQALGPAIEAGVQRARRRRRRRTRIASCVAALAVLIVVATPFAVPDLMRRPSRFADGEKGVGDKRATLTGPMNFLILGLDRRPTQPATEPARTDTIMIAHIPAAHDRGYLISVPRDLLVDIPGHGKNKINAAYAYGGARLTATVVAQVTGLTFDGAVEIRFEGLSRLTDALGGVPMCVDRQIVSIHTNRVFEQGCKRLSGDEALDLLRQRYSLPGGALDRDRNARQFIAALLDEAGRAELADDPAKLTRVLTATGDALTIDLRGIGPIDLARELRGLRGADLTGGEVPATEGIDDGLDVMNLDPEAGALFEALRADDLDRWFAHKPGK
jgi:LCP family protein required for cell wall assembly